MQCIILYSQSTGGSTTKWSTSLGVCTNRFLMNDHTRPAFIRRCPYRLVDSDAPDVPARRRAGIDERAGLPVHCEGQVSSN